MAWGNWFRGSGGESRGAAHLVGLDLNSSRARAVAERPGRPRAVLLEDPHEELPLAISLEKRQPEVGRAGANLCRRYPHLACLDYLAALGRPQEWRAGRVRLDPSAALFLTLERLRAALAGYEAVALVLPPYLTPPQVTRLLGLCEKARLPVCGSAAAPLALAADLAAGEAPLPLPPRGRPAPPPAGPPRDLGTIDLDATWVETDEFEPPPGGVIPLAAGLRERRAAGPPLPPGPARPVTGVVVDVDEHALTATLVAFEPGQARALAGLAQPRLGLRVWKERLLDCLADRCVRLCRRDPRDSAAAEQALYEQIDDALERARHGQKVHLTVRSAHWFQDLAQQPDDFDGYCAGLARQAVETVKQAVESANLPEPPRAVWLTSAAGRLPGLARGLQRPTVGRTRVEVLAPDAVARAAARLAGRWLAGALPRVHLDTTIPLPPPPAPEREPGFRHPGLAQER